MGSRSSDPKIGQDEEAEESSGALRDDVGVAESCRGERRP